MSIPDSLSSEPFADIPDPAPATSREPGRAAIAPVEPSPTRPERRFRSALSLAIGIAWVAVVLWRVGMRGDLTAEKVLLQLVAWTVVGILALVATLRVGASGLPPTVRVVQTAAAAVPALFLATALAWSADPAPLTWTNVRGCAALSVVMALGPVLLGALLFRRSFLTAPAWRGASVGAVCGLAGTVGVHAHCPVDASTHVLVAHGLPVLAGALVGAALGALRGRI